MEQSCNRFSNCFIAQRTRFGVRKSTGPSHYLPICLSSSGRRAGLPLRLVPATVSYSLRPSPCAGIIFCTVSLCALCPDCGPSRRRPAQAPNPGPPKPQRAPVRPTPGRRLASGPDRRFAAAFHRVFSRSPAQEFSRRPHLRALSALRWQPSAKYEVTRAIQRQTLAGHSSLCPRKPSFSVQRARVL